MFEWAATSGFPRAPSLTMSRHRRSRQCDCLGCADGQQGRPPSFWQRTQASFGTVAGPLSRSRWADPIGADDVRQQAVSGAMAHVDGGSDLAGGVAAAGTEQDHVRRLRDPLGGGSAARAAEPRLYAMLLRLHIMPWFGDLALDRITPPLVRLWRTDLLRQGVRNQPRRSPTAYCERS